MERPVVLLNAIFKFPCYHLLFTKTAALNDMSTVHSPKIQLLDFTLNPISFEIEHSTVHGVNNFGARNTFDTEALCNSNE